ncbi:hypothetical protein AJ78_08140 [Emergomyces pasteurianus Ep9510]|uniref:Aminoglycoside phosphotransferase domain-containing protein n=1 Tax=Emergomyces pasteurianus Ep9510 TaxID=1447872 RepID=A0A1J9P2L1_9EURO|nr:hypothetical protein AJ78_08140 [Emergomyces pasteurianus Ep9510]
MELIRGDTVQDRWDSLSEQNKTLISDQLRDIVSLLQKVEQNLKDSLINTAVIKFTHGDLHLNNIMISSTESPRILAVIDWAHAGWYSEYWEQCLDTQVLDSI